MKKGMQCGWGDGYNIIKKQKMQFLHIAGGRHSFKTTRYDVPDNARHA